MTVKDVFVASNTGMLHRASSKSSLYAKCGAPVWWQIYRDNPQARRCKRCFKEA